MSKKEEEKNKKLSYKFASHKRNLLKKDFPSEEFSKEADKARRAQNRFTSFIGKTRLKNSSKNETRN